MAVETPVEKANSALHAQIIAAASKLEPKLRGAILQYLLAVQAEVKLKDLVAAIESGYIERVISMLELAGVLATTPPMAVATAVQDGAWAGGALGAVAVRAGVRGILFEFNRLNPALIDFLKTYELNLIREINDKTKEAIRTTLLSGMTAGANPRDTARDVKATIGLTARQAKAVLNYRKQLEEWHLRESAAGFNLGGKISRAPGGAQVYALTPEGALKDQIHERRLRDFRYDRTLSAALGSGKAIPAAKIDAMVAAYARKYLRYRSEMIARTESLRTTNVGVMEAWRQAIQTQGLDKTTIRRYWVVARDERLCEQCAPVPGMNKDGIAFDSPFATPDGPIMYPPLHPACRCTVFVRQKFV